MAPMGWNGGGGRWAGDAARVAEFHIRYQKCRDVPHARDSALAWQLAAQVMAIGARKVLRAEVFACPIRAVKPSHHLSAGNSAVPFIASPGSGASAYPAIKLSWACALLSFPD